MLAGLASLRSEVGERFRPGDPGRRLHGAALPGATFVGTSSAVGVARGARRSRRSLPDQFVSILGIPLLTRGIQFFP